MATLLKSLYSRAQAQASTDDLCHHSRVAAIGENLIYAAAFLRMIRPLLMLGTSALLMILSFVHPAAAQQGQSLLNGNANQPINSIRALVDIGVWVLLALGIGGIGWGIWNLMTDKAWGKQMVGGGAALGFGGIVSMINAIANDDPITLPGL